ncbi:MAG: flagellar hook basal-body protein [Desulfobacteraceae bacterium]|nr:flagellar hook basal-body protein [Desulfobacteraceae bacterium]
MSTNAMFTAVTGMDTFGRAISVVADNIANANTTGYKSETAHFGDLVSGYMTGGALTTKAEGIGSTLLGTTTDLTTGASVSSGNWSDLMIQGNGYFKVNDAVNTASYYTRDGSFHIDDDGYFVNMNGFQVLDINGDPVQIEADPTNPVYNSYTVDDHGNIYGINGTGKTKIAQVGVTTFTNPEGLIRNGSNLYVAGDTGATGTTAVAGEGWAGTIVTGSLEGSNVDLAKEMVNLILYQSDFVANSKSIDTANQMIQTVTNLIR